MTGQLITNIMTSCKFVPNFPTAFYFVLLKHLDTEVVNIDRVWLKTLIDRRSLKIRSIWRHSINFNVSDIGSVTFDRFGAIG